MKIELSIIIPIYNEEKTIAKVIQRCINADKLSLTYEIIIINDCSNDKSVDIANSLAEEYENVRVINHQKNIGKGGALKSGFESANGNILLIQDGDLEYNPKDYPKLLSPIVDGYADAVYGSRFRTSAETRVLYFWHRIANGILTTFSNMFTNLNLSDMETGYKLFTKETISKINLTEKKFGVEPEITAKISKISGIKIYEVGISYFGRTYKDGKKIGLKDAFRAIYAIIKYNVF